MDGFAYLSAALGGIVLGATVGLLVGLALGAARREEARHGH